MSWNKIVAFLVTFAFGLSLYSLIHIINNREILENTSVNIVKTKENNSNQITNSNTLNLESKCNPINEDVKKYRHEEIKILIDKIEREKKSQAKHKLLYIRFLSTGQ